MATGSRLRLLALVLAVLSGSLHAGAAAIAAPPAVTVLDVGYGLAAHLDLDGFHVLIDGGPEGAGGRILDYLRGKGIGRLDLLVISHTHPDHVGGLPAILNGLPVGTVWTDAEGEAWLEKSGISEEIRRKLPIEAVGSSICRAGTWSLKRLDGDGKGDANDQSMAILVERSGWKALFPSDVGEIGQRRIARGIPPGGVDLMVWPHHGETLTMELEKALGGVGRCVVSTGPNPYGLPRQGLEETARRLCGQLLRTDVSGEIVLGLPEGAPAP
jgi:competence protein ComEC